MPINTTGSKGGTPGCWVRITVTATAVATGCWVLVLVSGIEFQISEHWCQVFPDTSLQEQREFLLLVLNISF